MTSIEHMLNQRRLEFIVHLAASEQYPFVAHVRVCPRKHPNPKCEWLRLRCKEAIPIFGLLSHEIERNPGTHSDSFFTVADALRPIPPQDIIRPEEASAFLDKLNNDKNQSEWIVDLTFGDVFLCRRFLRCNHRLEADAFKLLLMLQYRRIPGRGGTLVRVHSGSYCPVGPCEFSRLTVPMHKVAAGSR